MNVQQSTKIPFADLPEGTVTFLFTDIEGSTQLLHQLRDQYVTVLAEHHRLLRQTFTRWNGSEVDTQGDAFFVAFPRATQAVAAAVEAQRLLAEHTWPEGISVRVRMGLHTGEPIGTLPHPGSTFEAVFSQDGKRLATAGFDGFGPLFSLDMHELIRMAKARLTRMLTNEECQKYLHLEECPVW